MLASPPGLEEFKPAHALDLGRERIDNAVSQAFGDVRILLRVLPSERDFGGDREGNYNFEVSSDISERVVLIAAAVAGFQFGRTMGQIARNAGAPSWSRGLPLSRTTVGDNTRLLLRVVIAQPHWVVVGCRLWRCPSPTSRKLLHPDPHGHCRNSTNRPAGTKTPLKIRSLRVA
jgi:hypothetical protein